MEAKVAVIGAGIAGLSAGYHLKQAGFSPVILEKESFAGGRMSSEPEQGFIVDRASYLFPGFYENFNPLLREFGLENSLVKTPLMSSTFFKNNEYKIKLGSANDFLRYKLISMNDKTKLVKLFLYAMSISKSIDLGNPGNAVFDLEKQSTAEYLLEHYNANILEKIAYPIICERFLGTPENISKAAFLAKLAAFQKLIKMGCFAFAGGMGQVTASLAKGLDVRLDTPVLAIRTIEDGGPYQIDIAGDNPQTLICDAIVTAVPLPLVPGLFPGLAQELKEYFLSVKYSPSLAVSMAVDREYNDKSMIYNLLRKEFKVLGTVIFDQHKSPRRVPQGKCLATAILCEPASRTLLNEPEEKILAEVFAEMDLVFPGFSSKLLFANIYRWEYGAVQLTPGSIARCNMARKMAEEGFNNIYFASDGLYYSGVDIAFRAGQRAADRLIGNTKRDFQ